MCDTMYYPRWRPAFERYMILVSSEVSCSSFLVDGVEMYAPPTIPIACVTWLHTHSAYFDHEDGGRSLLWNVGIHHLHDYVMSETRKQESEQ